MNHGEEIVRKQEGQLKDIRLMRQYHEKRAALLARQEKEVERNIKEAKQFYK